MITILNKVVSKGTLFAMVKAKGVLFSIKIKEVSETPDGNAWFDAELYNIDTRHLETFFFKERSFNSAFDYMICILERDLCAEPASI